MSSNICINKRSQDVLEHISLLPHGVGGKQPINIRCQSYCSYYWILFIKFFTDLWVLINFLTSGISRRRIVSPEIQHRYIHYLRLSVAALLLINSNQTTSFASSNIHNFHRVIAFSTQYKIEIVSQNNHHQTGTEAEQYSIKAYSTKVPKLLSAITRPLEGHILEVVIEDINNDQQQEVVVIMESDTANKPFLMLDTYSFDGKNMLWKQTLPSNLLSSNMHTYLETHEIPSNVPRNTAMVLLPQQ